MSRPNVLGIDLSTQSIKLTVCSVCVDDDGGDGGGEGKGFMQPVAVAAVRFDSICVSGVHGGVRMGNCGRASCPPSLWMRALEDALRQLSSKVALSSITVVTGAAQQHGVVWCTNGFRECVATSSECKDWRRHVEKCVSSREATLWLDTSTRAECQVLDERMGGRHVMAQRTGSKACERFAAAQLLKAINEDPEWVKDDLECICLISSFLCSILSGSYAPVDPNEASGMNLLSIDAMQWDEEACAAVSPDVMRLLPPLRLDADNVGVGNIARHWVDEYGFSPDCLVLPFTGDNGSSALLSCQHNGDCCISLGTSDTLACTMDAQSVQPHAELGHIFLASPLAGADPSRRLALLCFANGSLARDRVRRSLPGTDGNPCSWEEFDRMAMSRPAGNGGSMGLYFFDPEILPAGAHGVYRFQCAGDGSSAPRDTPFDDPATEARAILEFRALSLLSASRAFGLPAPKRLICCGGASSSHALLQVLADAFGCDACVFRDAKSDQLASLGGCFRAAAHLRGAHPSFPPLEIDVACRPDRAATAMLDEMLERFEAVLARVKR